jgi:hypothetical protein
MYVYSTELHVYFKSFKHEANLNNTQKSVPTDKKASHIC